MNGRDFELKLNETIVEGLKAIDARTLSPAEMIYALEMQKSQLCQLFVMRAMQQQAQQKQIIIPRNGEIPPLR